MEGQAQQVATPEKAHQHKPPLLATGNFNKRAAGIAPVDKPMWPGGNLLEEIKPGEAISVNERQGDWLRIGENRWINQEYVDLNPTIPGEKEGETKPATIARGLFNDHSAGIAPVDKPMWPGGNLLSDQACKPGAPVNIIARQGDWLMIGQDTWINKEYVQLDPKQVSDSWKVYEDWLKRIDKMPPQIPPEAIRDTVREQDRLNKYLESLSPHERTRLDEYNKEVAPMDNECRIAVIIPAYHEENGIYHTLSEWENQIDRNGKKVNPNLYELNVIVNREANKDADRTLDEVLRFKKEHPHLKINVLNMVFPQGEGGVGAARKLITDLALLRSTQRGEKQKGALYIATEDADLLEIDRHAVHNLIKKFDEKPGIDGLRGKQDLAPEILKEHDFLFFDRRAERFTEYLLRDYRLRPEHNNVTADQRWNGIILGGWNSAFTAEAYALIGGYQPVRVGEDVDIGYRISVLRGEAMPSGNVFPNTNVIDTVRNIGQSNPRRFVYSLITGKHAYHTFGEHDVDEAIRNNDPKSILENSDGGHRITEENKELFEKTLTETVAGIRDAVKDPKMQKLLTERLMTILGFKKYREIVTAEGEHLRMPYNRKGYENNPKVWKSDYHIDEKGAVHIDNIHNIAQALEDYRQKSNAAGKKESVLVPAAIVEASSPAVNGHVHDSSAAETQEALIKKTVSLISAESNRHAANRALPSEQHINGTTFSNTADIATSFTPIKSTFKRLWNSLGFTKKPKTPKNGSGNSQHELTRRRLLSVAAGAALGAALRPLAEPQPKNSTTLASTLAYSSPTAQPAEATPTVIPHKEQKVPEKIDILDEFLKPLIEEALKKRAERAKNDPEYEHRVDRELNENKINLLLLGYGEEHGETYNDLAGPITILSYDTKTKKITSVSFSRDMRAPELERLLPENEKKAVPIRHVFRDGSKLPNGNFDQTKGFDFMRKTTEEATGLAIDYQVVFKDTMIHDAIKDFAGNSLEIDVPRAQDTTSFRFDGKQQEPTYFPAGHQTMDAMRAIYFMLGENKNPTVPEDERTFRKNLVLKALVNKATAKFSSNPIAMFLKLGVFLQTNSFSRNMFHDIDPNTLLSSLNGAVSAGKSKLFSPAQKEMKLPEFDPNNQVNINDIRFGGFGVKRVHDISEEDGPVLAKEHAEKFLPAWMLVPVKGNPQGDLIDDYWKSVRTLIKEKLSPFEAPVGAIVYPDEITDYNEIRERLKRLVGSHASVLTESYFTKDLAALPKQKREQALDAIATAHAKALIEYYGSQRTIIGLDPGHGGSDIGSSGRTPEGETLIEKDLTWKIAQLVGTKLHELSDGQYDVIMLRPENPQDVDLDGDGIITPVERIQKRKALLILTEERLRPNPADRGKNILYLSIHLNGSPDPRQKGTETFFPNKTGEANPMLQTQSKDIATVLQRHLVESFNAIGVPTIDRGAKEDPDKRTPGKNNQDIGPYVVMGSGKLLRNLAAGEGRV